MEVNGTLRDGHADKAAAMRVLRQTASNRRTLAMPDGGVVGGDGEEYGGGGFDHDPRGRG